MQIAGQEITQGIIAGLKLRFPNARVDDDLALMELWLVKNPSKTPKRPIRFIENWLKKSTPKLASVPKKIPAWWQSDQGTMAQAAQIAMAARPGETMSEFRNRIMEKLREAA